MAPHPVTPTVATNGVPSASARPMENSEILQALIDFTPEFLYAKDCAGRFTFVNRALARRLSEKAMELELRLQRMAAVLSCSRR